MLTNHLSILHINIQSLLPKLDLIAAESEAYDLRIFSESWLKPEIKSDSIDLTNFHSPGRRNRRDQVREWSYTSETIFTVNVEETLNCKV